MALTLSPAVRRVVLEHGLDPSKIKGTGKDGRLTKDDVLAAAKAEKAEKAAPAEAPQQARPAVAGERREERVRMTRLSPTIARRLKEAQNTAALLSTFNDVHMSAVLEGRSLNTDLIEMKQGMSLGCIGYFWKAACLAQQEN